MLDNSSLIKNLYFTQFSLCHFLGANQCKKREWFGRQISAISKPPEYKSQQINSLLEQFEEIYYLLSWRISSEFQKHQKSTEENLTSYIQSIDRAINIILIAPTPEFKYKPEKCILIDNSFCSNNKKEDLKRRQNVFAFYQKLQEQFSNVKIYDPYHQLCPDKECFIYDKSKDFLIAMDKIHLSIEASKYLTPHFENWLRQTYGE